MNAVKVTLLIVDLDHLGADEIKEVIENARYPNRCIAPMVMATETRDIGEWSDNHPFNKTLTCRTEFERLFDPPSP